MNPVALMDSMMSFIITITSSNDNEVTRRRFLVRAVNKITALTTLIEFLNDNHLPVRHITNIEIVTLRVRAFSPIIQLDY